MTRKKTRIGAMAFRAPTKTSPKMAIPVAFGHASPRMTPIISPQRILLTRLMLVHLLNNSFIVSSSLCSCNFRFVKIHIVFIIQQLRANYKCFLLAYKRNIHIYENICGQEIDTLRRTYLTKASINSKIIRRQKCPCCKGLFP